MDLEVIISTRIDKYLWSIRLFKTRSLAAEACHSGKVKNDEQLPVKASKTVKAGDKLVIRKEGNTQVIEVVRVIDKRVSFDIACACYLDVTPPEEKERQEKVSAFYFSTGKRGNKQARPTKRDRRRIDDFKESYD